VLGAAYVHTASIGSPVGRGWRAVFAAVPLMIPLFLGIETTTEIGEEVREPHRTIPKALALALLLTLGVYLAVAFTTLGILGPARLGAATAPLIEAARGPMGRWAAPLILFAATLAILKSLNAIFIVFSRYLFAMARSGAFPRGMAKVHPRWGTPHVAVTVAFLCAVLGLLLPRDLVFLFVAISIPTILKYMSTCICAALLIRRYPALAARSRLTSRRTLVFSLAWVGVAFAALIFGLGFETDWRPYVLIGGWGALGVIYWMLKRGAHADGSLAKASKVREISQ
ncbi:MAG: APC family permease, partial [Chloroflexota bacterium]